MQQSYFSEYYIAERSHWWFLGRLEILKQTIYTRINPQHNNFKILNVGIATGASTTMLNDIGETTSVEYDKDCCEFVKEKLNISVINASMTDLPFENESFDLICAFDVIEHIENDKDAIKSAYLKLKKGGHIFLTVPMFMSLWSNHDVINHHHRRYRKDELENKIKSQGLEIKYFSYFNSFLFPLIYLARRANNFIERLKSKKEAHSDFETFKTGGAINKIFLTIFRLENFLLKKGMKFPFGVSSMIIAKKK